MTSPAADPAVPEQTRALGRSLIDTFGAGWAAGQIDRLMSVFAPTAVFIETPFSEPTVGIDAIRAYWADTPYHQTEITFNAGEIYSAGPWFSTEFTCTFRRRRTGAWVDARGAIFCETDGSRITEMRMYWHRWDGGQETSKP
jgi:ketosteroid isomerase-like protein